MRQLILRGFGPLLALLLVAVAATPSLAADPPIYSADGKVAIKGADPVAYFTDGKPVIGKPEFSYEWMGKTWRFASAEHRDAFKANPAKYAPQYGGYCAYAVAQGETAKIEPENWTIVNGKLYLNYDDRIQKRWTAKRDDYIKAADKNWPGVLK